MKTAKAVYPICIYCNSEMVLDMDGELHCDNDECVADNYLLKRGDKMKTYKILKYACNMGFDENTLCCRHGGIHQPDEKITAKLKYLRGEIEAERISTGEIVELQSLARYIDPSDTLLLEWAGVPEEVK